MEVAGRFDVVILAGDHLDTNSLVDLGAQSVVVQKHIARLREKARLLICSGNHDLDSRNDAGEKVSRWILNPRRDGVASDGDSVMLGDTLFTICPWWDGPIVRAPSTGSLRPMPRNVPGAGSGCTTHRRRRRRSVGTGSAIMAISSSNNGLACTDRTSFSRDTCTRRRSATAAPGSTMSVPPGCSTPRRQYTVLRAGRRSPNERLTISRQLGC